MEDHYELIFSLEPIRTRNVIAKLPKWKKHRFAAAQSATQYDFEDGSSVLRQKLLLNPFYIEIIQLKSNFPFIFNYKVSIKRLFLYFMVDGSIGFYSENSINITTARRGHFYISVNRPGFYEINSLRGNNLALVISIDTIWALENTKDYPNLFKELSETLQHEGQFSVMPHCRIDEDVKKWLEQMLGFESRNSKTLKKMLEGYIRKGLEYYVDQLKNKKTPDVHKVKEYLDANFCDSELSLEKIVKLFPFSERTLYNHFMEKFQTTAVQYYTMLRMEMAKELIEIKGIPISEVWAQVGYRDPNTFRHAYINYWSFREENRS